MQKNSSSENTELCDNRNVCDIHNRNLERFFVMLNVFGTFIITLIVGSYLYTWNESYRIAEENNKWREYHQKVLDGKFDELKQEQRKLAQDIASSNKETHNILHIIMDMQKEIVKGHKTYGR